jgi:hypothetical protein
MVKVDGTTASRFTKKEKRSMVALVRKFGVTGGQKAIELKLGRYVSKVTLCKMGKDAGVSLRRGRPKFGKEVTLDVIREKLAAK